MNEKQAIQYAHERAMFIGHVQTLRRIETNGRVRFLLSTHYEGDEKRDDFHCTVEP